MHAHPTAHTEHGPHKDAPGQVHRLEGVRRFHSAVNLDTSQASRAHRCAQAQVLVHHVSTGREQARSGTCTLSARAQEHRGLQGIRWAARVWQGRQAEDLSWRRRAAGLAYLPLVQLVLTLQHPMTASLQAALSDTGHSWQYIQVTGMQDDATNKYGWKDLCMHACVHDGLCHIVSHCEAPVRPKRVLWVTSGVAAADRAGDPSRAC